MGFSPQLDRFPFLHSGWYVSFAVLSSVTSDDLSIVAPECLTYEFGLKQKSSNETFITCSFTIKRNVQRIPKMFALTRQKSVAG